MASIRALLPNDWNTALAQENLNAISLELKEVARLAFTKRNERHWRDNRVRNWLLSQFENKCWYSEARDSVSPIHVEHFRPKSSASDDETTEEAEGYWWLAFDWTNYRIGGHFLNSKKGNYFPLHNAVRATACGEIPIIAESPIIIDPTTNSASQISFDKHEDSCIAVCSDLGLADTNQDRIEVDRTLTILGLNKYDLLNQKRGAVWDECMEQINRYNAPAPAPNFKIIIRAAITIQLKKIVDYKAEFSSVSIACIQKKAPLSLRNDVFTTRPNSNVGNGVVHGG